MTKSFTALNFKSILFQGMLIIDTDDQFSQIEQDKQYINDN